MRGTQPLVPEIFVLGSFEGSCVVPQASAHGLGLQSLCSGEIVSELILEQGLLSHLKSRAVLSGRRAAQHTAMVGFGGVSWLPLSLGAAGEGLPAGAIGVWVQWHCPGVFGAAEGLRGRA